MNTNEVNQAKAIPRKDLADFATKAEVERMINGLAVAIKSGIIKAGSRGGGGPSPKQIVQAINKHLGSTAWQSGSAAEIVAALATLDPSVGTMAVTDDVPGDQTASTVVFGQKDSTGGSKATLALETEDDVVVVGTFTASHKLPIWVNGVEYHLQLDAV